MKLEGKVAIVTGGGRGLGREIALAYAQEGASLVLAARTGSEIEGVAKEIRALGGKAMAVAADVSQERDVKALAQRAAQRFGRIDILVNNAATGARSPLIKDLTLEEWNWVLAVNLTGAFLGARAVFPVMMKQKSGVIINVSSGLAETGAPELGPYCASKGGLNSLTFVLAREGAPHNIRANVLHPGGAVATRFLLEGGLFPPEQALRPAVIRAAAVWLASDEAVGVTGQVVSAPRWNEEHGLGDAAAWGAGRG